MHTEVVPNPRFQFYRMNGQEHQDTFAQDVARGLNDTPKWLPPKYFYDEHGSNLYEQICALPEYYPYRAELEILTTYAAEIHAEIGHLPLVEFGSGSATKTRQLLSAYEWAGQPFRYCPVDISRAILWDTAQRLLQEYRYIEIQAMHTDFGDQPEVIQAFDLEQKAIAFFGSSLGNFTPEESMAFLRRTSAMMAREDVLLLGIDLKKAPAILIPAYDDAAGVTAAFNLNLLHRINRELGGQFDPRGFEHLALYNAAQGRIEMHLRSRQPQRVPIAALQQTVVFDKDETIHTENSYKYGIDEVRDLGYEANLELRRAWFDAQRYFLVALFRPL